MLTAAVGTSTREFAQSRLLDPMGVEIEGWEETYPSGSGPLTTRAVKKKRRMLDYWRRHDLDDARFRTELGLD